MKWEAGLSLQSRTLLCRQMPSSRSLRSLLEACSRSWVERRVEDIVRSHKNEESSARKVREWSSAAENEHLLYRLFAKNKQQTRVVKPSRIYEDEINMCGVETRFKLLISSYQGKKVHQAISEFVVRVLGYIYGRLASEFHAWHVSYTQAGVQFPSCIYVFGNIPLSLMRREVSHPSV